MYSPMQYLYEHYWNQKDLEFFQSQFGNADSLQDQQQCAQEYESWCREWESNETAWLQHFLYEHKVDNFYGWRDQKLLEYILNKEKYTSPEKQAIDSLPYENWKLAFDLLYDKVKRRPNLSKNRPRFVEQKKIGNQVKFICSTCGINAKLLLDLKYTDTRSTATSLIHKISWLGQLNYTVKRQRSNEKICVVPTFDPYDYWLYEQYTFVNQCLVCSAYLDQVFSDKIFPTEYEENILKLIEQCLVDNYHYIARYPMIDRKILALKAAFYAVIEIYRHLQEGDSTDFAVKILQAPKRNKRSKADRQINKNIFIYTVSKRFNRILSLFFNGVLQDVVASSNNTELQGKEDIISATANYITQFCNIIDGTEPPSFFGRPNPFATHSCFNRDRDPSSVSQDLIEECLEAQKKEVQALLSNSPSIEEQFSSNDGPVNNNPFVFYKPDDGYIKKYLVKQSSLNRFIRIHKAMAESLKQHPGWSRPRPLAPQTIAWIKKEIQRIAEQNAKSAGYLREVEIPTIL